ncbi:MAG: DNA-binding protein [Candidatus Omnitrophica bacterium]|nr:DNA-binding protein [Candidatus Omnitrophota bacterium]MDD5351591.1 DNA-binding protein [Candidatus Omnitrophota bacterium]MDD5551026.1 DNA-binding protein [Candidatus Omnitrophota bacterium]
MISLKLKAKNEKLRHKAQNLKLCVLSFSFALCALHFTLCNAFADTISSSELINNAKQYDGKNVTYEGEVIGDIMARGQYCWLNINDGQGAIGIWIEKDLVKDILYTGGYKSKGDVVAVNGIFHRACLQHGGDLDIHAVSIRKIVPGDDIEESLDSGKKNYVITLLAVLFFIWILSLLKRR